MLAYQPVQAINQPVQTMYTQVAAPGYFITPVKANQTQAPNVTPEPVITTNGSLNT